MSRIVGFDPIVHDGDRILILGSMPSVESLHQSFYYANKTNRFWPMLAKIYGVETQTRAQRLALLEHEKIALWDVCHSCIRPGSADAAIREVCLNPIQELLATSSSIQKILCNGKTSEKLLKGLDIPIPIVGCPSTSAANARWRLEDLVKIYRKELLENG